MDINTKCERNTPRHIVIYSSGRSGSNRLLDLLDQHNSTNCRNEPDYDDYDIGNLWKRTEKSGLPGDFLEQWAAIVKNCALHKGARDRYDYLAHKEYLRPFLGKLWVEAARREKLRSLFLRKSKNAWPIPKMALEKYSSSSIIPVLKVSGQPQWFQEPHFYFEKQQIVHNIRKPHDYLNSWYNRFIRKSGFTNEEMYDRVLNSRSWMRREAGLVDFSSPYSFRNLLFVELWGWRFKNEALFNSLRQSPRYLPVSYSPSLGQYLA
jgi:hypothetical protein